MNEVSEEDDSLAANVILPEEIDFGVCDAYSSKEVSFTIYNGGSVPFSFHFEVRDPFIFAPMSGNVPPYGKLHIHALFSPETVAVYREPVLCLATSADLQEDLMIESYCLGIGQSQRSKQSLKLLHRKTFSSSSLGGGLLRCPC